MKIIKENWKAGWWIGDFEKSALRTKDFECCHKIHPKGEIWLPHYHKLSTELNYLIEGTMTIQGKKLVEGDVFIIDPMEIANPTFQSDCKVTVIKIPSIPGDKFTA